MTEIPKEGDWIWDTPLYSCDLVAVADLLERDLESANAGNGFLTPVGCAVVACPEAIPLFAARGADLNACYAEGTTPLCSAIENLSLRAVVLLLEQGASPNLPDPQGTPPLHNAIFTMKGDSSATDELLEMLLQAGADVNQTDVYGYSPLDAAYRFCSSEAVRFLIRSGAHTAKMVGTGATLGIAVLSENNFEAVATLLSNGIDINARDEENRTALHSAALSGDVSMVDYLLERGADPNSREDAEDDQGIVYPRAGRMPLHCAVDGAHLPIVRALLAAGAEVNAGSGPDSEWTPLMCAAFAAGLAKEEKHHQVQQIMRLLIEQGADVRAASPSKSPKYRSTALSIAAWLADPEDVALLLEFGAGKSPEELLNAMHAATVDNGYRNLPLLWTAGRKLTPPLLFRDVMSYTDSATVSTLLGRFELHPVISPIDSSVLNEADPTTGETPLIWLVRNLGIAPGVWFEFAFSEDDISILLERGADPALRDKEGYSALDIVRERSLTHAVMHLEQAESFLKRD